MGETLEQFQSLNQNKQIMTTTVIDHTGVVGVWSNFNEFLRNYNTLTETNNHTEAAALLVGRYGTNDDKLAIAGILERHKRTGYISEEDQNERERICGRFRHNVLGRG